MESLNSNDYKSMRQHELITSVRGLNSYQLSLLDPAFKCGAKIPGTFAKFSIPVHRYTALTYTTNASGNFCFFTQPNEIVDSAGTAGTTFVSSTVSAYDPAIPQVSIAGTSVNTTPLYNLTTNTTRQVRLVSASYKMTSLAAPINRTGTIYGALLPTDSAGSVAFGATTLPFYGIAEVQNTAGFTKADVANGEGVQVVYLPSDDDDLQFLPANTPSTTRHNAGDDVKQIVLIAQGLPASSLIRVEVHVNFEVVPRPGSILAGLETPPIKRDTIPAHDINHILSYHMSDVVKVVRAFPAISAPNGDDEPWERDRKKKRGPKIGIPINIGIRPTVKKPKNNNNVNNVVQAQTQAVNQLNNQLAKMDEKYLSDARKRNPRYPLTFPVSDKLALTRPLKSIASAGGVVGALMSLIKGGRRNRR